MHPDSSDTNPTAVTVLTFIAMALVCMAIIIGSCLRLAERLEPAVGDVVDFSMRQASQDMLPVDVTATQAGGTCVLSSDVMVRGGGSFVVVERQPAGEGSYLVHWAGSHTSSGTDDCGRSADLVVSRRALLDLAGVAGGFGVHLGTPRA